MEKGKILDIINKVIQWGLGGVLMIVGSALMVSHKYLDIDYPYWLIGGLILLIFGFFVWLISMIFNLIINLRKMKYENEIKELEYQKVINKPTSA